jgi:hypothetical protein
MPLVNRDPLAAMEYLDRCAVTRASTSARMSAWETE